MELFHYWACVDGRSVSWDARINNHGIVFVSALQGLEASDRENSSDPARVACWASGLQEEPQEGLSFLCYRPGWRTCTETAAEELIFESAAATARGASRTVKRYEDNHYVCGHLLSNYCVGNRGWEALRGRWSTCWGPLPVPTTCSLVFWAFYLLTLLQRSPTLQVWATFVKTSYTIQLSFPNFVLTLRKCLI